MSRGGVDARGQADYVVAAAYALQLAEVAERLGVARARLLRGFELSEDQLAAPGAVVSFEAFGQLIERARALTGEPGLGIHLGLQERVSAHGFLGFAAMTARTLREALKLAVDFAPTRSNAVSLRLEAAGSTAVLVVDERTSLGLARDVFILSLMIGFWRIGVAITGREVPGRAECAFEEPAYFARFAAIAQGRVRFGRPMHRLVFDSYWLDTPLVLADEGATRLAREQCERELAALSEAPSMVLRVRDWMLAHGFERTPALDSLASSLAMSPRTLKRRLEGEGTSYSKLLEEIRRSRATELLRSDLSIAEIAERLGYSDAANFARAFRRWTGRSPGTFRSEESGPRK